ncbi:mitochondrial uncoupling protein 2-like isoform X2 [Stegostoma tigrinum]|uniref:mitochondrial uncoupling protein 2-like isoform X2 n=1 Tax=Stegostoma tigrinum TaxID=3053191 RepID=UPI00202ADDDC|nr:mitochondrial uncoupling protein 2-like isoform X2 [Stegostoma tigrinum]
MVGLKPTDVPPTNGVKVVGAGAAACVADLVTFPLDTTKVRLQIQGESKSNNNVTSPKYRGVFGTMVTIVKTEGARSLYNGLVAGLQRQMSFASVRIGLYDSVKHFYTNGSDAITISSRLLAGCTTGAMAVTMAQPTDVVKVRFQAQLNITGVSKRYSGTIDAYRKIAKEEGLPGLWKDNLPCHFCSAFGAGFCTTIVASPVDVVKTRYMNSAPGQYSSALSCSFIMLTKEGFTAFYKGFMPSFLRLGSWNVVMFVTYEQLKRAMMLVKQSWE